MSFHGWLWFISVICVAPFFILNELTPLTRESPNSNRALKFEIFDVGFPWKLNWVRCPRAEGKQETSNFLNFVLTISKCLIRQFSPLCYRYIAFTITTNWHLELPLSIVSTSKLHNRLLVSSQLRGVLLFFPFLFLPSEFPFNPMILILMLLRLNIDVLLRRLGRRNTIYGRKEILLALGKRLLILLEL